MPNTFNADFSSLLFSWTGKGEDKLGPNMSPESESSFCLYFQKEKEKRKLKAQFLIKYLLKPTSQSKQIHKLICQKKIMTLRNSSNTVCSFQKG